MGRMKCKSCGKRRHLRGGRRCDDCTLDWAYVNGLDEWEIQMRYYGYADVPDRIEIPFPDVRVAVVAETRWNPDLTRQSILWDTPLTARQRARLVGEPASVRRFCPVEA